MILLIVIAFWELHSIDRTSRETEQEEEGSWRSEATVGPVIKLHQCYQIIGIVSTSLLTTLTILGMITLNRIFVVAVAFIVPFVSLLFLIALVADPKSGKLKFESILFISFAVADIPVMIWNVKLGHHRAAAGNAARFWFGILSSGTV